MKKVLSLMLSVMLLLVLVGCDESQTNSNPTVNTQITELETPTEKPSDKATEMSTDVSTESGSEQLSDGFEIEWTEISDSSEDTEGYTYDFSVKLSPWILLSNTEKVNSTWKTISSDKQLPNFSDWGLDLYNGKGFNNFYERKDSNVMFFHTMTDMYYCFGVATITNTTDGWDINEQNTRNITKNLYCTIDINDVNSGGSSIICKTYFNDVSKDYSDIRFEGIMKENSVTIPFIIMAPENYSPNYPNGEYYEAVKNTVFYSNWSSLQNKTDGVTLGIIGKDNQFVSP